LYGDLLLVGRTSQIRGAAKDSPSRQGKEGENKNGESERDSRFEERDKFPQVIAYIRETGGSSLEGKGKFSAPRLGIPGL